MSFIHPLAVTLARLYINSFRLMDSILSTNHSPALFQQISEQSENNEETVRPPSLISLTKRLKHSSSKASVKSSVHFEDEPNDFDSSPLDLQRRATDTQLINILKEKIEDESDNFAAFQLGQLYMEKGEYILAKEAFELAVEKHSDLQALFQLAVLYHDGLLEEMDSRHAFTLMLSVANKAMENKEQEMLFCSAAYHIGLAYYLSDGVKRDIDSAERWWLKAAKNGSPKGSVSAQLSLGFHYCDKDYRNLNKAFFWFSEACGNGSLEAQGALGVMYFHGIGVNRDLNAAFECLREASERGNVHAQGYLVYYYYIRKLFSKCTELGSKLVTIELDSVEELAKVTNCLPLFIRKGIAIACFILGRCLEKGKGVQTNMVEGRQLYRRSFQFDSEVCAEMQTRVNLREI